MEYDGVPPKLENGGFIDSSFSSGTNRRRSNLLRLGFGCLAVALLGAAVIFAIVKLMPSSEKSGHIIEKKGGKY
jgi:hypothetical protein